MSNEDTQNDVMTALQNSDVKVMSITVAKGLDVIRIIPQQDHVTTWNAGNEGGMVFPTVERFEAWLNDK